MTNKLDAHRAYHETAEERDGLQVNESTNRSLNDIIACNRRNLLKGGLGLAFGGFFAGTLSSCGSSSSNSNTSSDTPVDPKPTPTPAQGPDITFKAIALENDPEFDVIAVPEGYTASNFFSWGDAVVAGAAAWLADGSNTAADQAKQAGQNHDGMWFFPFEGEENSRGLLVMNHEYINVKHLHPNGPTEEKNAEGFTVRPVKDEVDKELEAHGVSVIEVRKDGTDWNIVAGSQYNRRISATTEMQLTGAVAGTDYMRTAADANGTQVFGTLNNCAMGYTPWGTYLACEENWQGYFVNRDEKDYDARRAHNRYGVRTKDSRHDWESVYDRFNATPNADAAYEGYVNEPNKFGWVVEIDPWTPDSTPKKRTSMGRLIRECSTMSLGADNRMAFYFGDDTRGEYVYKFVPSKAYNPDDRAANLDILDEGTMYVARFNEDGSGEWLPLIFGQSGLTIKNGFASQADVLLNARSAADVLGATTMDRPEWVAVDPKNRDVYVTLTNNKYRGVREEQPLNKANPRENNKHGQIVRWTEQSGDPTATSFKWEVFLLAGDKEGAVDKEGNAIADNLIGNINGDVFSSPDGLWFDYEGRLWIQTDGGGTTEHGEHNQMLVADPVTREVKRFLNGPAGCEVTGVTSTPDGKTMWVNIQHPGLSFPASDGKTRPRSTTVMITKDDGGVIGT